MGYRYAPCELCGTPIAYGRMEKHRPGCERRSEEDRKHYKEKMDEKRAHYNERRKASLDRTTRAYELALALKIAQRILDLPEEERQVFIELLDI